MKIELSNNQTQSLIQIESIIQQMYSDAIINEKQFGSILMTLSTAVEHTGDSNVTLEYAIQDHFVEFSISNCLIQQQDISNLDINFSNSSNDDLALIVKLADDVSFCNSTIQFRFELDTMQNKIHNQRTAVLSNARIKAKQSSTSNTKL